MIEEFDGVTPNNLAIGIPAKGVCPVTEAETKRIREGAKHYLDRMAIYKRSGK